LGVNAKVLSEALADLKIDWEAEYDFESFDFFMARVFELKERDTKDKQSS